MGDSDPMDNGESKKQRESEEEAAAVKNGASEVELGFRV
jgi:hypothetical protein